MFRRNRNYFKDKNAIKTFLEENQSIQERCVYSRGVYSPIFPIFCLFSPIFLYFTIFLPFFFLFPSFFPFFFLFSLIFFPRPCFGIIFFPHTYIYSPPPGGVEDWNIQIPGEISCRSQRMTCFCPPQPQMTLSGFSFR